MADTEEVFAKLKRRPGVTYRGLWLNTRGLDRAVSIKNLDPEGVLHVTASETFVKRNTNRSIDETFSELPDWIAYYKAAGINTDRIAVMAAFGCNFEGDVPLQRVIDLIAKVDDLLTEHAMGISQVTLADTMAWANPLSVKRMVEAVRTRWPQLVLKLHLHDTRGLAIANAFCGATGGCAGVRWITRRSRRLPLCRTQGCCW